MILRALERLMAQSPQEIMLYCVAHIMYTLRDHY